MAPISESNGSGEHPRALRLSDLDGQEIVITDDPLREVVTKFGPSTLATMATLHGNAEVWVPKHVVALFVPGDHAGKYLVYSFTSKYGRTGYSLRNVP